MNEIESAPEGNFRTNMDYAFLWKCIECDFESFYMYKADTHQAKTDHAMDRIKQ